MNTSEEKGGNVSTETAAPEVDLAAGLDLLRCMVRIRRFEEQATVLFASGELRGGAHSYIGEEASAAGVCSALRTDDYITSNHRGHGHVIAKGGDLNRCMAELFGKATGYCHGKGGSMHLADISLGIIGANGIVGAGIPIGTGAGLSARLRGTDQVSVVFFGDGAANAGPFSESMNLSAMMALPVIFLCENNHFAELTRTEDVIAPAPIAARAAGYGIPASIVDGNDVHAVHAATAEAVARARAGGGPTLIESQTYRIREHSEGIEMLLGGPTRSEEELAPWRLLDPIERERRRLVDSGVSPAELETLEESVHAEIAAAVAFAQASPDPEPASAFTDVWFEPAAGSEQGVRG